MYAMLRNISQSQRVEATRGRDWAQVYIPLGPNMAGPRLRLAGRRQYHHFCKSAVGEVRLCRMPGALRDCRSIRSGTYQRI